MDIYTPYALILALTYVAAMGAFTVAFLVDWIRRFEQIRRYWRHAVAAGAILVCLHGLMIAVTPDGWSMMRVIGFMSLPLLFVRVVGFAMLGMHYCVRIECPSFRLRPPEPIIGEPATANALLPPDIDAGPQMNGVAPELPPVGAAIPPEPVAPIDVPVSYVDLPISQAGVPVPDADHSILDFDIPVSQVDSPILEIDIPVVQADVPAEQTAVSSPSVVWSLRDYAWDVLLVVAGSVAWSATLFLLTRPHVAEMVRRTFGMEGNLADAGRYDAFTVLLVLTFAFGEEIFFRLGIQNFLAKYLRWYGSRYWAAIVLTSLLWTLGHVGVLDPNWVKFAQIFPVGLMLGWLFHRHGVEACMLAHGLFNIIMIGLSSLLLT